MKNVRVSHVKARQIVRGDYGRLDFPHVWGLVQQFEAVLLNSGAKLWKRDHKYWIGGYADDGSDVEVYLKGA